MAEYDDILRKIQKCLDLANDKRGDPSTAAIAMNQAKKLMEAYNVSHSSVLAASITEERLRSKVSVVNPAGWEGNAMYFVASAFGCRLMWTPGGPEPTWKGYWIIFGPKMRVGVCVYSMTVVMREILKARTEFVQKLRQDPIIGDLTRGTKSKMADDFCFGWGYEIRKKVTAMADPEGTIAVANQAYVDELTKKGVIAGEKTKMRTKDDAPMNMAALALGAQMAQTFNLHRPMDQSADSQQLQIGA